MPCFPSFQDVPILVGNPRTSMDSTKTRAAVLLSAKERLRAIEEELRERITDLRSVTIGDDNAESASQTESTHGSDVELMNSLGEQLEQTVRDRMLLDGIPPEQVHAQVEFGSIVHSKERNFLIAVGIDEFTSGGRTYLGLSPRAPLFQGLQGRKSGDEVEFNKVKYRIIEVH